MILSDKSLKKMIKEKSLVVRPLRENSIQPASIDCHLDSNYLCVEDRKMSSIELDKKIHYRKIKGDKVIIPPASFLLASTKEYIELPDHLTAFVEGRSSIGRMGLFIQNAGWVDPGFKGKITLELFNASSLPIVLKENRRICQLVFCKMDQKANKPYRGKYQGQKKVKGTLIFEDKEVIV